MALFPYPNIPKLPGVPAIPRSPNFPAVAAVGLGIIQGALWRAFQVDTRWGIYDSKGKALGDPSTIGGVAGALMDSAGLGSMLSTVAVDYSKETKVSDFPVERGSFASYNKVEAPSNPVVTLTVAGGESARRTFLEAIDKASKSTDLYSVVTPEKTYINYNVERYNYQRRNSRGTTLIIVEIALKEIRQVSAAYSKKAVVAPKKVAATPSVDSGKIQSKVPKVSTLKSIVNKVPSLADRANKYITGVLK